MAITREVKEYNKKISKLSDKLTKINESYTINMYDNGYMVEASGRNKKGDYLAAKIMCSTIEEVIALVSEAAAMDRDN